MGWSKLILVLFIMGAMPFHHAYTDPADVIAINRLYRLLEFPNLPKWVRTGGDPCGDHWPYVGCNRRGQIISISIVDTDLRGSLKIEFGLFPFLEQINLDNNHLQGIIPINLPATLHVLILSSNQLVGPIPTILCSYEKLSMLLLNNNMLSGNIPDCFQHLPKLIKLDLSSNNLTGHLPQSMKFLSALTILRLQRNNISGSLDVLRDLPLKELDIQNNSFTGPIPESLQKIPNFKTGGNPLGDGNDLLSSSPSPLPSVRHSSPSYSPRLDLRLIMTISFVGMLILLAFLVVLISKIKTYLRSQSSEENQHPELSQGIEIACEFLERMSSCFG